MNTPTPPPARRSDLDALRAVAMLLGIALHASLSFFPSMWVVQDSRQDAAFGVLFSALHGFRMPTFFVMSGFFAAMLLHRLGPRGTLKHRFRRVVLPMMLGLATVVPLTNWISAVAMSSASAKADGTPTAEGTDTIGGAAAAGDLEAIRRHLDGGADVNAASGDFRLTPLHRAALGDHAEAADLLLARGADADAAAIDGGTPLHAAAFVGHEAVVATLLERGADVNAVNGRGATPLDNANVDAPTTLYYASLLKLAVVEDGLGERKAAIVEKLRAKGAGPGRQAGVVDLLMQIPLFGHLWFLWFLWWLTLGLAAVSVVGAKLPTRRLPAWLVVTPARYLWLVPLTMIPQWLMGDGGASPIFGPDTSSGLLPIPHVLAYYAIFFGFGALDYRCDARAGRVGSPWWPPLAVGLLVAFPLGMALATGWPAPLADALAGLDPTARRVLSVTSQAAYPWLMTFGLMGLFRRLFSAESPTMRYLSDSAYWLYLAHLPLIVAAQYAVRDWPLAAPAKFALIVVAATAFLLMTYRSMVRYTWIGRMLNGRRERPARPESA